jgi:DNA uptake protein ComE-like DNA-binding protein
MSVLDSLMKQSGRLGGFAQALADNLQVVAQQVTSAVSPGVLAQFEGALGALLSGPGRWSHKSHLKRRKPMQVLRNVVVCLGVVLVAAGPLSAATKKAESTEKVDLNTAAAKDLEDLPGVGPATAKKIIAGRPYAAIADLAKAGVPARTITQITPLVTVGPAAPKTAAAPAASVDRAAAKTTTASTSSSAKVDLNTGSEKDLEALPRVGPATAKKIIAGRPYAAVADLSKAGVPANTIDEITPLVTVGAAPAAAAAVPAVATSAPPAAHTASPAPPIAAASAPPAGTGMVWVNTASKVYHREGDRWYGKTKAGKYMTESDALAAGYRAAKEQAKKQ